jgi:hypothetical protein
VPRIVIGVSFVGSKPFTSFQSGRRWVMSSSIRCVRTWLPVPNCGHGLAPVRIATENSRIHGWTRRWRERWSTAEWKQHPGDQEPLSSLIECVRCTYTGRPLHPAEFVATLEQSKARRLATQKAGRRKPVPEDCPQLTQISFGGLAHELGLVPSVAFTLHLMCPCIYAVEGRLEIASPQTSSKYGL